jgi:predicted RNase H-like HicB family nuclease
MMMTTTHVYRDFVFTIRYRVEEPGYVVRFPDIPEIITSAETLNRAFAHACEALDLHLETLQKLERPLPEPRHRLVVETT